MVNAIIGLLLAAVLGAVLTWCVRAAARRLGLTAAPNPIVPQHTRSVAHLGGVAIAIAMAMAAVILMMTGISEAPATPVMLALAVPTAGFLGIGVIDDLKTLTPPVKFALQSAVAAVAVLLGAVAPWTSIGWLDAVLSWFFIVTVVNAFNMTDVCDGLVPGLAAILYLPLALLDPATAPWALVVAGACLGFLVFNRPPATIFLGDSGSHLLGFLAAVAVMFVVSADGRDSRVMAAVAAPLLVAVPLFELVFLTIVRTTKGLPWWRGSPDHFSLRLQAAGLSRWQTDLVAWAVALAFGVSTISMTGLEPAGQLLALAIACALLIAAGWVLKRFEVERARALTTHGQTTPQTATCDGQRVVRLPDHPATSSEPPESVGR